MSHAEREKIMEQFRKYAQYDKLVMAQRLLHESDEDNRDEGIGIAMRQIAGAMGRYNRYA